MELEECIVIPVGEEISKCPFFTKSSFEEILTTKLCLSSKPKTGSHSFQKKKFDNLINFLNTRNIKSHI